MSPCLGIAKTNLDASVAVYPNPASLDFVIELPGSFAYTIFDALGKKISGNRINENSAKVNTSQFSKGLYFIEIEKDTQKTIKKIVVE